MNKKDCFNLGHISKPFGFKGEVVFFLDVDSPEKYKTLESVFIELNEQLVPFYIKSIQLKNHSAVVKLDGIDNQERAGELVKAELYLPLSFLPPLTGNQFYFHEVIGFQVIDKVYGNIGIIKGVLDFPQQQILQVQKEYKEILFPVIHTFIVKVDRVNKILEVDAPEGLIDIYLGADQSVEEED